MWCKLIMRLESVLPHLYSCFSPLTPRSKGLSSSSVELCNELKGKLVFIGRHVKLILLHFVPMVNLVHWMSITASMRITYPCLRPKVFFLPFPSLMDISQDGIIVHVLICSAIQFSFCELKTLSVCLVFLWACLSLFLSFFPPPSIPPSLPSLFLPFSRPLTSC